MFLHDVLLSKAKWEVKVRRFTPHGLRPRSIILNEKYFFNHGMPDKAKVPELEVLSNVDEYNTQAQQKLTTEQKSGS